MVNNFEEQLQKKALWMSVTAFALILLPRLLRKIFGITAGRVNFAGQKAGFPVKFGSLVTGEQFIEEGERRRLREEFSPLAVDMETAAAAHVCYVNKTPFLAVRTITDTEQEDGQENFELNCEQAAARAKDMVRLILEEWKNGIH